VSAKKTSAKTCEWCGEKLDAEESGSPRIKDGEVMCDDCYDRNFTFNCYLCGGSDDEELTGTHVVVLKATLAFGTKGKRRGIYKVLKCPYHGGSLLGPDEIFPDAVKWHTPLPKTEADESEYACGHLCGPCLEQHAPTLLVREVTT
jgi:hypothetical protein